jgi:hypothetical protein
MNTRRGFLTSILKLGVGSMILPPAVTYARKQWVKRSSGLYFIEPKSTFDIAREQMSYPYYSYNPDWEMWKKLIQGIKWEPNMGDTILGTIK